MARVAQNEFSHHDRCTENLQQLRDYYIVFNGVERKEKRKCLKIGQIFGNFRVIIGDALKIIEETNRRIESLLMFTNIIGKIAEKLFLRTLLKSNILRETIEKEMILSIKAIEGQCQRYRYKKLFQGFFFAFESSDDLYNTRTCTFDNNAKIITISQHARLSIVLLHNLIKTKNIDFDMNVWFTRYYR